ncbi:hypothetical protein PF001_g33132, partial [Phytophthora fragariae]
MHWKPFLPLLVPPHKLSGAEVQRRERHAQQQQRALGHAELLKLALGPVAQHGLGHVLGLAQTHAEL